MRPDGDGLTDQERYDQGMEVRRAVLSDAHVDRSTAAATSLTAEWQDFITRVAWGDVWIGAVVTKCAVRRPFAVTSLSLSPGAIGV